MKYFSSRVFIEILDELHIRFNQENEIVDRLYDELCVVVAEDKEDGEVLERISEIVTNMRCHKARMTALGNALKVIDDELNKARDNGEYVVRAG